MVLVDDVRTTGATMDECARVLLAAVRERSAA
jgi:predicted amidophosphoribosyltransferase